MIDINLIHAAVFEKKIGPYTEQLVAVYNSARLPDDEVAKLIPTGEVEDHPDVLVLPEAKWVRIFRDGNPFPD